MRNGNRLLATGLATGAALFGGGAAQGATDECSPAAQVWDIREHLQEGGNFQAHVIEPLTPHADIQVIDAREPGEVMVNPLVIENGQRVVSYVARKGKNGLEILSVNHAEVRQYLGEQAVAERRPQYSLVGERVVHAMTYRGNAVVGFTDGQEAYGLLP